MCNLRYGAGLDKSGGFVLCFHIQAAIERKFIEIQYPMLPSNHLRIGPFTSLGPLRNTPEAATVGLLCGCAVVGIASCLRLVSDSRQVLATCMIILVMNPSLACFGVDRSVSN